MVKDIFHKRVLFYLIFTLGAFATAIFLWQPSLAVENGKQKGILLSISGAIGPAVQDYIQRGIEQAEKNKASVVILKLDTPGGLESSMRGINRAILGSKVPVVAYVSPRGARAASAGTYILYASHIAAMAPGTNIGAATPVNLMGEGTSSKDEKQKSTPSTHELKSTHDSAAYMRSLAELRGRNIEWGESAVRQAVSISAEEALKLKVIDLIANDIPDLLNKINDRKINTTDGDHVLKTTDLEVLSWDPGWRYKFLSIITDPTIAYLLLLIGIYGLFFEFSNPGMVLPGVVGAIGLVLGLYALQLMPVNYAGFALLILGIAFMVAEAYVGSFGALGIGGIIAFVAGSILLLDTEAEGFNIAWQAIAFMTIISTIFFLTVMNLAIRSHRRQITTGREGLIGSIGVIVEVSPEKMNGWARILGEIWQVHSKTPLKPGMRVRVLREELLKLEVESIEISPSTGETS